MTALARHRDRAAEGGFQPQALSEETVKHGAAGIDLNSHGPSQAARNVFVPSQRDLCSRRELAFTRRKAGRSATSVLEVPTVEGLPGRHSIRDKAYR